MNHCTDMTLDESKTLKACLSGITPHYIETPGVVSRKTILTGWMVHHFARPYLATVSKNVIPFNLGVSFQRDFLLRHVIPDQMIAQTPQIDTHANFTEIAFRTHCIS
jgi:hypothetical protein